MKKIALLLVLLMCVSLFGCGKAAEKTPSGNTPSGGEQTGGDTGTDDGYGGKEFTVWQESSSDDTDKIPLFFITNTTLADKMIERVSKIESDSDCKINFYYSPDINTELTGAVSSGVAIIDMLVTASQQIIYPFAENGSLVPMTDVSDIIDLTNHFKYGSIGELEALTVKSVPYAVSPVALPGKQNFGLVSIGAFLEDYVKENNLTSPREYLENKNWNWDAFKQCLTEYTIPGEDGIKAFNMRSFVFAEAALLNNGVQYVVKDESGNYVSGLDCPQTLEALTFQKSLITDYKDCLIVDEYLWGEEFMPLRDKKTVMALFSAWSIKDDLAYNVSNFGLFPFPTGPSGVYGEWKTAIDVTEALTIPVLAEDETLSARLISDLLEPMEGYETSEALAAYYDDIFFDDRDSELFFNIAEGSSFSYWNVGGYKFVYSVEEDIEKRTPQEIISRYSTKIKEAIEDYMVPNYDFINGTAE